MTRQRKKFTREQKLDAVRRIEHGEVAFMGKGRVMAKDECGKRCQVYFLVFRKYEKGVYKK